MRRTASANKSDAGTPTAQSVLLTDLYPLTMVTTHQEPGMDCESVFEFFARKLPASRDFLVAAELRVPVPSPEAQ